MNLQDTSDEQEKTDNSVERWETCLEVLTRLMDVGWVSSFFCKMELNRDPRAVWCEDLFFESYSVTHIKVENSHWLLGRLNS